MRRHVQSWGPQLLPDGARFRVWAPDIDSLQVQLEQQPAPLPMESIQDGWHELLTPLAAHGSRYWFALPDGTLLADPASRWQPAGVWGPSEIVDLTRFAWRAPWRGRPWHEAVIYELHVGTFTPEGTFLGIIPRLPHLVALGITALELMPVGSFAGCRNWGYDGVLPFAPASCYGRPEDLQALVDAAHLAGIMVFLDVVYNHFGPEGNQLPALAAGFYTERHQTPWGAGFQFSASPVRQFFIENALYWLQHYRLDGLRLDAVHAIVDDSPQSIIEELAVAARGMFPDAQIHLILENEDNRAALLQRLDGRQALYTAQWNDDVHHALHVALTGEASGYYGDYRDDPAKLGRSLAEGFAFQGEFMPYRGDGRGEPSEHLPPTAFIAFIQNHDQIGNRAFGERLTALAPPAAVRAAAAIYLLLPQIPMLFMGEEWDCPEPFPFFCDFGGDLARAVTAGRRAEFSRFPEFADPAQRERIPDPIGVATFESARLQWEELERSPHHETLQWYRRIIAVRHQHVVPLLPHIQKGGRFAVLPSGAIRVTWELPGQCLVLILNLQPEDAAVGTDPPGVRLWQEGQYGDGTMGPWSVLWTLMAQP